MFYLDAFPKLTLACSRVTTASLLKTCDFHVLYSLFALHSSSVCYSVDRIPGRVNGLCSVSTRSLYREFDKCCIRC
jgi:hypothetical protein